MGNYGGFMGDLWRIYGGVMEDLLGILRFCMGSINSTVDWERLLPFDSTYTEKSNRLHSDPDRV